MMIVKCERAARAFLLLMVIQFHCEILLAEKSQKHNSTSNFIIEISSEKDSLENVFDDEPLIEEYPDDYEYTVEARHLHHNSQNSDSDTPVIKVPARRSRSNDGYAANLRQFQDGSQDSDFETPVTKLPARRSRSSNSGYAANLRQLLRRSQDSDFDLPVTKLPARRSRSSNRYAATLRQLLNDREQTLHSNSHEIQIPTKRPKYTYNDHLDDSDESQLNSGYATNSKQLHRRSQHLDLESPVTKVPARRSQSSNSGYAATLRQLLNDREQTLHSNSHEIEIPTRRPKYTYIDRLDDSDESQRLSDSFEKSSHRRQSQRSGLKISPKHKSEHSEHEHPIDLTQSLETHLHPETAHANDQVLSRKSEAARRSANKASLRMLPDSKQQSNSRRSLFPSIKLAKLGLDGIALLPQVFLGEAESYREPKETYYEKVPTVGCPEGTRFVIDHCEPIVYFEYNRGPAIKKIVRTSDVYLDDEQHSYEI